MKKRLSASFMFVVSVLVILAIWAVPAATSQAETIPKVLKLGYAAALSGPAAGWGIPILHGVQTMEDYINEKGGLNIGGKKVPIKVMSEDTLFTPEGAAAATNRLVDAGAHVMYACLVTHVTLAAQKITEPAKIITVNTADDDAVIIGKKYSFRSYLSPRNAMPGVLRWLAKTRPGARLALIGENTASGWFTSGLFKKFTPRVKIPIVYLELVEVGTKDFYPYLTKALAAKPDVIFMMNGPPGDWALIVKQARELGFKGTFMREEPPDDKVMVDIAGLEGAEGVMSVGYATTGPHATAEYKALIQRYKKRFKDFNLYALMNVPTFLAIFQAMENLGTIDSDKVVAELEKGKIYNVLGMQGAFGGQGLYGRNAQWLATRYMLKTVNGESQPFYEIPMEDILHGWD